MVLVPLYYSPPVKKQAKLTLREPACMADQVKKAFLCNADEGVIRLPLSLKERPETYTHSLCLPDILRQTAVQMCFVQRS